VPDQPNVLLISTDQQFADAIGCVTDELETPAMDELAARGTRFTEAYCSNPLCSPSRACMFSGAPSHQNGVTDNNHEIADEYRDRTLGHLLSDAGYDCGYAGEWHVPNHEIGPEHGFERVCGYSDERVPDAAAEFIERDRDDPFFLVASFDNPHNICEWGRNQPLPWGGVEEVPVEECPTLPENFPIPPYEPDPIDEWRTGPGIDMTGASPDEWRRYRHAYFRLIERVDAAIGRVLDALDAAGLTGDTVVVFTSDHGDMGGAHRLQQKHLLYDEAVRVPLVVAGPGVEHGVDDRLVSTGLDLLPTLCDYADAEVPADLRGRSLRPIASGEGADEWRDYVVTQSTHELTARMVRTPRYKYTVYEQGRPREQLFDVEADRGEMVNLAVDADHEDVLQDHRELLLEWCLETGDEFMSHYATGIDDLPTVPGFEYGEVRERADEY